MYRWAKWKPTVREFEVTDEHNTLGIKEALKTGFNRGGATCAVVGSIDGSIPGWFQVVVLKKRWKWHTTQWKT